MKAKTEKLSKRERQIMDIIYKYGHSSVSEVQDKIADDISYSTVRAILNILENKGYLKHETIGAKYVYIPKVSKKRALSEAINNFLDTFCDNSVEQAVTALLEYDKSKLSEDDYEHLNEIINKYKQENENE